jgi:hypothetical protein
VSHEVLDERVGRLGVLGRVIGGVYSEAGTSEDIEELWAL